MAEQIQNNTQTEKPKFDPKDALNKRGFASFLAKHRDADNFDMSDVDEVEKRYAVFVQKEEVAQAFKDIAKQKIKTEWKMTIGNDELSAIDAKIEKMAVESPEELARFNDQMQRFNELPGLIEAQKKELEKLGSLEEAQRILAESEKSKDILDKAEEQFKWGGKVKMWANLAFGDLELFKEKYNKVKDVEERFGKTDRTKYKVVSDMTDNKIAEFNEKILEIRIDTVALRSIEIQFDIVRKEINETIGSIAEIAQLIKAKVKTGLDRALDGHDLFAVLKAHEDFQYYAETSQTSETGINAFEDDAARDQFGEGFERNIEELVYQEVYLKINDFRLGNNDYSRLCETLSAITKIDKLGSKEGNDAKRFIIDQLKQAAFNLDDADPEKGAKKILVNSLTKEMEKSI
jgi:hypothetical protein